MSDITIFIIIYFVIGFLIYAFLKEVTDNDINEDIKDLKRIYRILIKVSCILEWPIYFFAVIVIFIGYLLVNLLKYLYNTIISIFE